MPARQASGPCAPTVSVAQQTSQTLERDEDGPVAATVHEHGHKHGHQHQHQSQREHEHEHEKARSNSTDRTLLSDLSFDQSLPSPTPARRTSSRIRSTMQIEVGRPV